MLSTRIAPRQLSVSHDFDYGAIALGLRYWAPSSKYFQTRYTVNGAIKQALDEAGIALLTPSFPVRPAPN